MPVVCYSQSTLLIIIICEICLWCGYYCFVSAACLWHWSRLVLPRYLIRGISSGTGDQSQIATWVAGGSVAFLCCTCQETSSSGSTQGSVSKSESLAEEQCSERRHSSARPRTKTLLWYTAAQSSCNLPWFTAPCSCFSSSLPRRQQKTRMTTHFSWDGQRELIIILEHWHLE